MANHHLIRKFWYMYTKLEIFIILLICMSLSSKNITPTITIFVHYIIWEWHYIKIISLVISSSIWIQFRVPFLRSSVTPHFFSHFFASIRNANRFWNNGWILTFQVSKRPYRSCQHDEIISRWRHHPPGGENWN